MSRPAEPDLDSLVGATVGSYRVLSILGRGGMGIVYLAEQRIPVVRKVAIKVIKIGLDSHDVMVRFEAERQALAVMSHPNIAQIFDGGRLPEGGRREGSPYFAMEYVKGIPITEHCDAHRLTVDQRIRLFCEVCAAVQHAHQKGVIHRDLKPSNILVAYEGNRAVPKIIDFGVAKALNQRLTEKTLFTEQGQLIGTPEYMSPEQAEMGGQDIDTRSDIYSLGVILYELLTGLLPLESEMLRKAGFAEIQRVIREVEPQKPSTKLSSFKGDDPDQSTKLASSRSSEHRSLVNQVRGDLDWIVMKCLEKDRGRRYATAIELEDELHRFIAGAVVEARAPSAFYRISKFSRRHRGAVFGTLLIGLILIVATVFSSAYAFRAHDAEKLLAEKVLRAQLQLIDYHLLLATTMPVSRWSRDSEVGLKLAALNEAVRLSDEVAKVGPDVRAETAGQILLGLVKNDRDLINPTIRKIGFEMSSRIEALSVRKRQLTEIQSRGGDPVSVECALIIWHLQFLESASDSIESDIENARRYDAIFDDDLNEKYAKAVQFLKDALRSGSIERAASFSIAADQSYGEFYHDVSRAINSGAKHEVELLLQTLEILGNSEINISDQSLRTLCDGLKRVAYLDDEFDSIESIFHRLTRSSVEQARFFLDSLASAPEQMRRFEVSQLDLESMELICSIYEGANTDLPERVNSLFLETPQEQRGWVMKGHKFDDKKFQATLTHIVNHESENATNGASSILSYLATKGAFDTYFKSRKSFLDRSLIGKEAESLVTLLCEYAKIFLISNKHSRPDLSLLIIEEIVKNINEDIDLEKERDLFRLIIHHSELANQLGYGFECRSVVDLATRWADSEEVLESSQYRSFIHCLFETDQVDFAKELSSRQLEHLAALREKYPEAVKLDILVAELYASHPLPEFQSIDKASRIANEALARLMEGLENGLSSVGNNATTHFYLVSVLENIAMMYEANGNTAMAKKNLEDAINFIEASQLIMSDKDTVSDVIARLKKQLESLD